MINKFENTTKKDIDSLEEQLSIKLPNDYKLFLSNYNGGIVEKNGNNKIYIEELDEYISLDVIYGINTGNKTSEIITWMEKLSEDLLEGSIIIGDDLLQGMIVMITKGEYSGIYYWDDAYNFEKSTDDENTYKICNTFEEFLGKIETP